MNQIFAEIDSIPWGDLSHAYGSAEDIPEQLKTLWSGEEELIEKTLYSFFGNIYHQGTIYSATSYAVPFLIQALAICPISQQASLTSLLSCIAHGMSYKVQHQHLWEEGGIFSDGRVNTQEYQDETREQLHWVEQGILSVWQGWPVYCTLLGHPNEGVRLEVPLLMVTLLNGKYTPKGESKKDYGQEARKLFLSRMQEESSPQVRGSLLMGVTNLDMEEGAKRGFLNYYLDDEDEVVRLLAAYKLFGWDKSEKVLHILSQAAQATEASDELLASNPWFDFRFSFTLLSTLCSLPLDQFDRFWPILDAYIRATHRFGAEFTVSPIIDMVFKDQKVGDVATTLSEPQKKVLKSILETENLWDMSDGNTSAEFQQWGLERDRKLLKKMLDGQ